MKELDQLILKLKSNLGILLFNITNFVSGKKDFPEVQQEFFFLFKKHFDYVYVHPESEECKFIDWHIVSF